MHVLHAATLALLATALVACRPGAPGEDPGKHEVARDAVATHPLRTSRTPSAIASVPPDPAAAQLPAAPATATAAGAFRFAPIERHIFDYQHQVKAIAVGDVDGDNLDDVVMATEEFTFVDFPGSGRALGTKIVVMRQSPTGGWRSTVIHHHRGGPARPPAIALGDLDGDGRDEIITTDGGSTIEILRLNDDGTLRRNPIIGWGCSRMAAMDIDADGRLDLACLTGNRIRLLYGDGQGDFRGSTWIELQDWDWRDMQVTDLTGDGIPDLVLLQGLPNNRIVLFPHDGSRGLSPPVFLPLVLEAPDLPADAEANLHGFGVGDFDSDGLPDVIVGIDFGFQNRVGLLQQSAGGVFLPSLQDAGVDAKRFLVADFDGDGDDDIFATTNAWGVVFIEQVAAGDLLVQPFGTGDNMPAYSGNAVAMGDIDSNGCADALIVNGAFLGIYKGLDCIRRPRTTGGDGPRRR